MPTKPKKPIKPNRPAPTPRPSKLMAKPTGRRPTKEPASGVVAKATKSADPTRDNTPDTIDSALERKVGLANPTKVPGRGQYP